MGIRYERSGSVFLVIGEGDYSVADLKKCLDDMVSLPDFPDEARVVVDSRRSHALLTRSIRELREEMAHFQYMAHRFGNRVGLVVEGSARYGLMRMVSMWLRVIAIEGVVFRDLDEAQRWAASRTTDSDEPMRKSRL